MPSSTGRWLQSLAVSLLPSLPTVAEPPAVVATTPTSGDVNVDPTLARLEVRFDRPMDTGSYSFTGSGPAFPATTAPPQWASPTVCLLPVALEPGRVYSLGINGGRFNGFRDLQGTPASPEPLLFATAGEPGLPQLTAADNRKAIATLRTLIARRYSHRERLGLDWDAIFEANTDRLEHAANPLTFALATRSLLAPTDDAHITISVGNANLDLPTRTPEPNYNGRAVGMMVPNLVRHNDAVITGRFDDGVGYLLITTWDRAAADLLVAADAAITRFADAPGLIIDVRPNAGGDEQLARKVAGRFIETETVYAQHQLCDPEAPDGFTEVYRRSVAPAKPTYRGRVCVLMGQVNMSSAEAFILMMRQVNRCTMIGARSYGSSGKPQSHQLPNGVTISLPSWRAMDADGSGFEGIGLEPDITVPAQPTDRHDPVIDEALELLRQ